MSNDDDWRNVNHALERHEAAIEQDAAEIRALESQVALLCEAFEKLQLCGFQQVNHSSLGTSARDRIGEIVKELHEKRAERKT